MDRTEFLARKVQTKDVTLADETVITIRKLTQADIETMTEKYSKGDTLKKMEGLRYIVSRAVVDDEGKRLFTDADLKTVIRDMDTDLVQNIAKEACKFSGLKVKETKDTDDDKDADEKND